MLLEQSFTKRFLTKKKKRKKTRVNEKKAGFGCLLKKEFEKKDELSFKGHKQKITLSFKGYQTKNTTLKKDP